MIFAMDERLTLKIQDKGGEERNSGGCILIGRTENQLDKRTAWHDVPSLSLIFSEFGRIKNGSDQAGMVCI